MSFNTSDGHLIICCGNDHLFNQLCQPIGRPELITDTRFLENHDRMENNAALKQELEVALKTKPVAHWLEVIHEAGVPVGPLLNAAEAAERPQTKARNMLIEAGGVRMPANPVKISGYDDSPAQTSHPAGQLRAIAVDTNPYFGALARLLPDERRSQRSLVDVLNDADDLRTADDLNPYVSRLPSGLSREIHVRARPSCATSRRLTRVHG